MSTASIRGFVEAKLSSGLSPGTVGVCVHVLSALLADLIERGLAQANPCRGLPRSLKRLVRSDHDPEDTPFVERIEDVRRIFLALPEPIDVAYALGAMAGLRTGEVIGLRWRSVDLAARRVYVRESSAGPTKDEDTRVAPVLDPLYPVLAAWKVKSGGQGRVIPSRQPSGEKINRQTLWRALRAAEKDLGFPAAAYEPGTDATLTWYRATRHTFAS